MPCKRVDGQPPVKLLIAGLAVSIKFLWTSANKMLTEHHTKQAEDALNATIHRIYWQEDGAHALEDGRYVHDCELRVQAGCHARLCLILAHCVDVLMS